MRSRGQTRLPRDLCQRWGSSSTCPDVRLDPQTPTRMIPSSSLAAESTQSAPIDPKPSKLRRSWKGFVSLALNCPCYSFVAAAIICDSVEPAAQIARPWLRSGSPTNTSRSGGRRTGDEGESFSSQADAQARDHGTSSGKARDHRKRSHSRRPVSCPRPFGPLWGA